MELRSEQNSSSAIRVEHLHYSYPAAEGQTEHVVFDNLDLTIEQGSFVDVYKRQSMQRFFLILFYPLRAAKSRGNSPRS